jgi:hypothetical protein
MAPVRNDRDTELLPEVFCWTKFGDEAGEAAGSIFDRKEVERERNCGTFLWGIGQSIRPSLTKLLNVTTAPEVLFSPIRSAPARRDVLPSSIVVWYEGAGLDGRRYVLPENSLVTSRRDDRYPRDYHFALVCERSDPIHADKVDAPCLRVTSLRNLVSGAPIGSSQVTSVVRRLKDAGEADAEYPVVATARLVAPYLVRLTRGLIVSNYRRPGIPGQTAPPLAMDDLLQYRHDQRGEDVKAETITEPVPDCSQPTCCS